MTTSISGKEEKYIKCNKIKRTRKDEISFQFPYIYKNSKLKKANLSFVRPRMADLQKSNNAQNKILFFFIIAKI